MYLLCFKDGLTALHLAADGGHYECVKVLLESHCDINGQSNVQFVNLKSLFVIYKRKHICGVFWQSERYLNVKPFPLFLQRNMSALHYVAQHGFDREASLLLEAGINIDAVNNVSKVNSHMTCFFLYDISPTEKVYPKITRMHECIWYFYMFLKF